MLFPEFLENINKEINQIAEIKEGEDLRPKFRYHIFILIGIGIEMLGAAIDEYEWFEVNKSKERFNNSLSKFPSLFKYKDKFLYEHLRCGMCHVYVPNGYISLNCKAEGGENLQITNPNQTLIQMESFLEDFNSACDYLLENIEMGSGSSLIKNIEKVTRDHLSVPSDIVS